MKNLKLQKLQHLLTKIPKGRVSTYKEMARAMGTKGYRYIGQLLGKNPEPDKYPCYKVVCSDGSVGGYAKGVKDKIQHLRNDGIVIKKNKILNFDKILYQISERSPIED